MAFPYPRGTLPAYGMMAWNDGSSNNVPAIVVSSGATLIHLSYATSVTTAYALANVNAGKNNGISNYMLLSGGGSMNTASFWQTLKTSGVTENDFLGLYMPDEATPATLGPIYNAIKSVFPNAICGCYAADMMGFTSDSYASVTDVVYATGYTMDHSHWNTNNTDKDFGRHHCFTYAILDKWVDSWKAKGKTFYCACEAFADAVFLPVSNGNPNTNTNAKIHDKMSSQIVMSILGGAQGVFPYKYYYRANSTFTGNAGTPNWQAWVDFKPRYEQVWPWIMKGSRTKLAVTINSGIASQYADDTHTDGLIPAVVACKFLDASNNVLIVSSSMLDYSDTNGVANTATIAGVPNGTYTVLWENRSVTVTNGTIADTWGTYGYHFYQLGGSVTPPTPPSGTIHNVDSNMSFLAITNIISGAKSGDVIQFAAGTYYSTVAADRIYVKVSNITLNGAGKSTVIYGRANGALYDDKATCWGYIHVEDQTNVTLSNIWFNSDCTSNPDDRGQHESRRAMVFRNGSDHKVQYCGTLGFLYLDFCSAANVKNITMHDCDVPKHGHTAFYGWGGTTGRVYNCSVGLWTNACMRVDGASVEFDHNYCYAGAGGQATWEFQNNCNGTNIHHNVIAAISYPLTQNLSASGTVSFHDNVYWNCGAIQIGSGTGNKVDPTDHNVDNWIAQGYGGGSTVVNPPSPVTPTAPILNSITPSTISL